MKVVILGAGRVASHLLRALIESTVNVTQIYNRTLGKAQKIAEPYNLQYTDKISEILPADLYIIAASNEAVTEISYHIPFEEVLVVHTSGSLPMDALKGKYRKGVVYPFQTLAVDRKVKYEKIPFFIESEQEEDEQLLVKLFQRISNKVKVIKPEQRYALNLSSVYVCNFVNYLYDIGDNICREVGLTFEDLRPLIEETAQKVQENHPSEVQTGPAKKNDEAVIEKHLQQLDVVHKEYKLIYETITKEILKTHTKEIDVDEL